MTNVTLTDEGTVITTQTGSGTDTDVDTHEVSYGITWNDAPEAHGERWRFRAWPLGDPSNDRQVAFGTVFYQSVIDCDGTFIWKARNTPSGGERYVDARPKSAGVYPSELEVIYISSSEVYTNCLAQITSNSVLTSLSDWFIEDITDVWVSDEDERPRNIPSFLPAAQTSPPSGWSLQHMPAGLATPWFGSRGYNGTNRSLGIVGNDAYQVATSGGSSSSPPTRVDILHQSGNMSYLNSSTHIDSNFGGYSGTFSNQWRLTCYSMPSTIRCNIAVADSNSDNWTSADLLIDIDWLDKDGAVISTESWTSDVSMSFDDDGGTGTPYWYCPTLTISTLSVTPPSNAMAYAPEARVKYVDGGVTTTEDVSAMLQYVGTIWSPLTPMMASRDLNGPYGRMFPTLRFTPT